MTGGAALLVVAVGAALFGVHALRRALRRGGGPLVVHCPVNHREAIVTVDAWRAVATLVFGHPPLCVRSCSVTPSGCAHACVGPERSAPRAFSETVAEWYRHRRCVRCGGAFHAFPEGMWTPALRAPDGRPVGLESMTPSQLLHALQDHDPLCWNCAVIEVFEREHPELIVRAGRSRL